MHLCRTVLQTEPVLGGKRLDLLKIYKTVLEAGGYEQVMTESDYFLQFTNVDRFVYRLL